MPDYFVFSARMAAADEAAKGHMEVRDEEAYDHFTGWRTGELIAERPAGPVEIKAIPRDRYKGLPDEMYDFSVPMMSARLKLALDAAGVDNINYFPVTLRNTKTNAAYEYFAFNLVGLVSAADPGKSEMSSYDGDFVGDTEIRSLSVDETRARGLLIFRLAEKFSIILVHRRVKETIEKHGIDTMRFRDPEGFMAL
jgi:hypothetical protein